MKTSPWRKPDLHLPFPCWLAVSEFLCVMRSVCTGAGTVLQNSHLAFRFVRCRFSCWLQNLIFLAATGSLKAPKEHYSRRLKHVWSEMLQRFKLAIHLLGLSSCAIIPLNLSTYSPPPLTLFYCTLACRQQFKRNLRERLCRVWPKPLPIAAHDQYQYSTTNQ